jgi:hypothetical protein
MEVGRVGLFSCYVPTYVAKATTTEPTEHAVVYEQAGGSVASGLF